MDCAVETYRIPSDTILESVVYTEERRILEGHKELDEAMEAIVHRVEIYLYE